MISSPHAMLDSAPRKIDLKKDQRLRIEWADGGESIYPLTWLRQMCPCAACRTLRTGSDPHQLMQPAAQRRLDDNAEAGRSRDREPGARVSGPLSRRERVSQSEVAQATERVTGEGGTTSEGAKSLPLRVLPKHFTSDAEAVTVTSAELVGNYAIQINFSDGHTSGIYSFVYLREIARG